MPVEDKPLPPIEYEATDFLSSGDDLMAQMREATYSPSPLLRILNDPTLLSSESAEDLRRNRRRPSRSPGRRREHRSPLVAAIAIAEEERQANHLKALLRSSGDRLEYEMRRADDATARASFAERQESEALARAKAAEAENERMEIESMRLERDSRNYQIQLEASQRETRRLQDDMHDIRREMEDLQNSEAKAHESVRKYQLALHELQIQMRNREVQIQGVVDRCYEDGREDGYDEGYEKGYDDGRKSGLKEGLKKGRKEGVKEGREEGRNGERRNAIEAFEKFLSEDMDDDRRSERTRRWAQSIYMADDYSESLGPMDSGSVL
ncbi:hypothetical protein BDZ97DRAFT_1916433 [Flammula alnicola]|nr:hypothetical protein BDZ97DRAFT_1916433 [Flammula alnicola]